jgi:hypothetical protein
MLMRPGISLAESPSSTPAVAKGNELTLYILDADAKPIDVDGGSAKDQILLKGKTSPPAAMG